MAAIASFRAGGWADTNTATNAWNAAPPTNADTVTVTHTVTLDSTACVCDTLTINAGGNLVARTTGNSKLVVDKGIIQANSATAVITFDMSSCPQYTCEIQVNADGDNTATSVNNISLSGPGTFKGASKNYYSLTDGALTRNSSTQCDVEDATGWLVGDILVFAMTQAAVPQLTVSNVTYNGGGGYLEVTTSTAHGLYVGDEVMFSALQTALNEVNFVISAVPTTTTFRITMGAVTVTDTSGFTSRQARTDKVTIASITAIGGGAYSGTGPATITWADGGGTGGSVKHDHDDVCVVGNFTRNLIFAPGVSSARLTITHQNTTYARLFDSVMFRDFSGYSGYPTAMMLQTSGTVGGISNCSFYNWRGPIQGSNNSAGAIAPRANNIYYTTKSGATVFSHSAQTNLIGPEENMVFLRANGLTNQVISVQWPNAYITNPLISGVTGLANSASNNTSALLIQTSADKGVVGGAVWSCTSVLGGAAGSTGLSAPQRLDGVRLGIGPTGANYSANNLQLITSASPAPMILNSCPLGAGATLNAQIGNGQEIVYENKGNDAALQEVYKASSLTVPVMSRVTAGTDVSNATSSLMMEWTLTAALEHTRSIYALVAAGATATILIRVKKNATYGSSTRPTVTAYDGVTAVSTATMADTTDTWETLTLYITNSGSSDKQYRVEFYGKSAVNGAKCWFSGVPIPPFVTRCRHYGYLFDETSATRTIDLLASASFATADAYTGMSITWGASSSASITDNNTFQKFFDYHQAKATANVGSAVALTGAGVAGSPALFAAGNVTISTGKTLSGSGSLSMGAHTLSTEFASGTDYTYTGGTFSQASTTPAFSGGVLTLPTKITGGGDFSMTGGTVEFGAAGADWNLSAASYSGTITLKTTAGQSVTVAMPTPSGFTIDNTEPGNITVTSPVVMATGTVSNLPIVGNLIRLQIYNMSTDTIIYSDDPGSATYSTSYVDGVGISDGDTLRIRFVELNGGTSFKFFSMLVDATSSGFNVDANNYIESNSVYALNGVDGSSSTVTDKFSADFSLTDPQINLKITSNFIAAEYYAFWCFLLTDEVGIGIFWGGITANDVGNYQTNVGVVDMYLDNITTASQRQTDSARIYRSDGAYPVLDPTTSGYGIDLNWQNVVYVVSISGSSVLSPTESAQLMSLPSAAVIANEVVNVVTFP